MDVPTSSFFIRWKERKQHKFSLQRVVGKYFLPRKTFFVLISYGRLGNPGNGLMEASTLILITKKKKALVALSFMFTLHPSITMVVCHRIFAKKSSWNFCLMTPEPWKVSGKWDKCLLVKEINGVIEQMIFLWNRLKFWSRENTVVHVSIYMSSFPHYVLLYLCDLDYFQKSLISMIPSLNLESCVDP